MPIFRGFSANLSPNERIDIDDLFRFIRQFEGTSKVIFIYRRNEVQLHGIRYSSHSNEIQFLLKEIQK